MSFKIITADERIERQSGFKIQVWGPYGVGKTSLLHTLPGESTMVIDLEAGMRAVQGWSGCSIPVRDWPTLRDVTVWMGGPNPAMRQDQCYSQAHFDAVTAQHGEFPKHIKTVFIDSTSNVSRYCLQWAHGQPDAISERTGKPDMRGAYGLLGREIVAWCEHLQHIGHLNVILVGGLEEKEDDFGRKYWKPLIEGATGASKIPYIFDQVLTMTILSKEDNKSTYRAFVCTKDNPWGFPAKDRSGRLEMVEPPHLGKLLEKMTIGKRTDPACYTHELPQAEGE